MKMGKILQHKSQAEVIKQTLPSCPPPPPTKLAHSLWQCLLFMGKSPAPSKPDPQIIPVSQLALQSSHTNTVSTPPRPRDPNCRLVPPPPTTRSFYQRPPHLTSALPPSLRLSSHGVVPHAWQTPSRAWMCLGLGRNRSVRRGGGGLERHRLYTEYVSIMSWDDGIRCGP